MVERRTLNVYDGLHGIPTFLIMLKMILHGLGSLQNVNVNPNG